MSDELNKPSRIDKELAFMLQFENIAWYDDGCVRILDRRVYPNKVHFVECKTHINNPTDIDKFKSAVNNYGGSGSKSLFVTYFPTDKDNSIKEKFSDNYMPNFAYNYKKPEYINCNELNSYINKILDTINKK